MSVLESFATTTTTTTAAAAAAATTTTITTTTTTIIIINLINQINSKTLKTSITTCILEPEM